METTESNLQSITLFSSGFQTPTLSLKERKASSVLITDSDKSIRQAMRQTLMSLGFTDIQDVASPKQALERLEEKQYHYLIFEAKNSQMGAKEFLTEVLELDPKLVAIPSSYEPTVDDVFDLLIQGARGFVVKPFNTQALDDAIAMAAKGDPISDSILYTRNRNEALASLVLASVDRLALILKQAKQFETARREIDSKWLALKKSVEIGKTFARGGASGLRYAIVDLAVERAERSKRSIGRLHSRVNEKRQMTIDGDPVISNRPKRKMEKKRKKA